MISYAAPTQSPAMTLAQMPPSQEDNDRKQKMKQAWTAYRGEFQHPLKVRAGQPDDNVISNRCGPIVNKGASFLFGQVLRIEATDELQGVEAATHKDQTLEASDEEATPIPGIKKAKPPTPVQDFINGLWGDDDDKMTFLNDASTNGGVCGMPFVKLVPPAAGKKYPRIVNLDPQLVRPIAHPEDCELILAFVIEYPTFADWQKRQVIARVDPEQDLAQTGEFDVRDTWTITNYVKRGNIGVWIQVGETIDWPYPFAPIFCCKNLPNPNETWGAPDLTQDLIDCNKSLNFIRSNASRILKYHAHPKTWVTGAGASQLEVAVDEVICFQDPNARIGTIEMSGDLAASLNFASTIRDDMDEQSRVPGVALGRLEALPRGNISGVALQLLFQPLLEKTEQKRRLYGKMIREITKSALILAGLIDVSEYEDYKIGLKWPATLPTDDLMAAQTAILLDQLGVSRTTLIANLGFNPEDEADARALEIAREEKLAGTKPTAQTAIQQGQLLPTEPGASEQQLQEANQ